MPVRRGPFHVGLGLRGRRKYRGPRCGTPRWSQASYRSRWRAGNTCPRPRAALIVHSNRLDERLVVPDLRLEADHGPVRRDGVDDVVEIEGRTRSGARAAVWRTQVLAVFPCGLASIARRPIVELDCPAALRGQPLAGPRTNSPITAAAIAIGAKAHKRHDQIVSSASRSCQQVRRAADAAASPLRSGCPAS